MSGEEVGRLAGDDLDAAVAPLDAVGETLGTLLGHRDAGDTLDLDHIALAVQLVGDEVGGGLADAVVVTADPGPVRRRAGELAVDVDDRDARLHCLLRDRGERTTLMREDDQDVRLLADERLDLGDLGGRVVRTLRKHQLDSELVRRRTGVVGDRLEPAVVCAGGAERNLDGTAADTAGLLGLRSAAQPAAAAARVAEPLGYRR